MAKASQKQLQLKSFRQYLIAILAALVISYIVIELFHPVIVSGSSMYPTLEDGDIMISSRTFDEKSLKKGDIVVFKVKNVQMIKRIIATSGDEIWIENGMVFVNNKLSPYQYEYIVDPGILSTHFVVPPGEYFCLGDNRNHSQDCRVFGTVNLSQIKSKIMRHAFKRKEL